MWLKIAVALGALAYATAAIAIRERLDRRNRREDR